MRTLEPIKFFKTRDGAPAAQRLVVAANNLQRLMDEACLLEEDFDGPQGAKGRVPDLQAYHWKQLRLYDLADDKKRTEISRRSDFFVAALALRLTVHEIRDAVEQLITRIDCARIELETCGRIENYSEHRQPAIINVVRAEKLRDQAMDLADALHTKSNEVLGGYGLSMLLIEYEATRHNCITFPFGTRIDPKEPPPFPRLTYFRAKEDAENYPRQNLYGTRLIMNVDSGKIYEPGLDGRFAKLPDEIIELARRH